MIFKELFNRLSIIMPYDLIDVLESHKVKQNASDFSFRLMNLEEIIELIEFMSSIEVYHNIIPLWTDDNSNYVGVYYQGPLKYRVCYIDHEETDISPGFRSLSAFIYSLEQDPDFDWDELKKDYPTEAEINIQDLRDDENCINDLNNLLTSARLNDDLRCQIIFSLMAVTPKIHLHFLVKYLDDEDMYVQERACEILGYHRYIPAKDKLIEVSEFGMHNGKLAAKKALSRIRENSRMTFEG